MNSVDSTVNLEEIWQNGATLESEAAISEGARVELRCGSALFAGQVTQVERHEFGCRAQVEFSPLTLWNPDEFRPRHMLDVAELKASESQAE